MLHLRGSSARLELAKAHLALGVALKQEDFPSEAEEEFSAAADQARQCGAAGLARLATEISSQRRATAESRPNR